MNKGNLNLFIRFRLVYHRGKNGKLAIYVRFTVGQKRVELSTHYVDPKIWDAEGQFVKGKTEEAQTINRRLALINGDCRRTQSSAVESYRKLILLSCQTL